MIIKFGFEDNAYAARATAASPLPASTKKRLARRPSPAQQAYGAGKTVGQVAQDIEKKYQLVERFYDLEENGLIIPLIEEAFSDAAELAMVGSAPFDIVSARHTDRIEAKFRRNLTSRRYDGVIKGVPTLASQKGVSHLFRRPGASRSSRPSFVDTGLYMRSFKTWVE